MRRAFCLLVCLFATSMISTRSTMAQGVGASGSIKGAVTDATGAGVPASSVTAVEVSKGVSYEAVTDSAGDYQLNGLPPATYDLEVRVSGFQPQIQKGIVVTVGSTVIADLRLELAARTERIEVNAAPPVVETARTSQADTMTEDYVSNLPIDRRDYLTFTLLSPGVSNSTRLAGDKDFRAQQTGQSGLSFYGSNGRGNSVTLDGGEANGDAGDVRLTVGQDAVQEFQINRSNYSAQLGSASGASVNIVTKSGTNEVHGGLFTYVRNDALDARDPFAFSQALQPGQTFNPAQPDLNGTPIKNSLDRYQYGADLGFPIQKDKTFAFFAFEGLLQDAQNSVPLLTSTSTLRPNAPQGVIIGGLAALGGTPVPCLTGQPALPAATCAAILTNVLTVNPATSPLNAFLVNEFEDNGGVFPNASREYLASGRLDHIFDNSNEFFLRYNFGQDNEASPDVQSLTGFSRGSSTHNYDHTLQASWFHQFDPTMQNEFRAQWNYQSLNVIPNASGQVGLDIAGFGNFGTNIFLPNYSILRRWEFADNVSKVFGPHTMRFGLYELIRGDHSESDTFFPGRFVFGDLPGGILSPCLQVPAACGLAPSVRSATINSLQSAALGLPQFYEQGFGNPAFGGAVYAVTRPFTAAYWEDSWAIRPNFLLTYGLRYELDRQSPPLNTDSNNLAPRISFAWDPFNDRKTAVRGGFGIFYSPTYVQIGAVTKILADINGVRQIPNLLVPLTTFPVNSAAIFQTLFAQGAVQCSTANPRVDCITPASLTQFGINVSNTAPLPPAAGSTPFPVLFSSQPNFRSPYSEQAELGVEHELVKNLSVSMSYIYTHTLGLPVAIDSNALATAPLTSVTLANGKTVQYRNWAAPQCSANPLLCFANPLLLQTNVYSSKGSALFQGGILEIKKRFSDHFTLLGNYTYSKAFNTTTDFNSDFGPEDNTNLAAERALSDFDERHKIVVAGVFESPWRQRFLSGFQVSPIVSYHSGLPFNLLTGSDVNGDRHYTNDRPIGAPRNTGLGPNFVQFDSRLGWRWKFTERYSMMLTAEAFNLFNRTNYASVNNIVDPSFALPAPQGLGQTTFNVHGFAGNPSSPLAFTSDFPKREFQLGARFEF